VSIICYRLHIKGGKDKYPIDYISINYVWKETQEAGVTQITSEKESGQWVAGEMKPGVRHLCILSQFLKIVLCRYTTFS
jgi:hypothetical protein